MANVPRKFESGIATPRSSTYRLSGRLSCWKLFQFPKAAESISTSENIYIKIYGSTNYDRAGFKDIYIDYLGNVYTTDKYITASYNVEIKTYDDGTDIHVYLFSGNYCDVYDVNIMHTSTVLNIVPTVVGSNSYVPTGTLVGDSSTNILKYSTLTGSHTLGSVEYTGTHTINGHLFLSRGLTIGLAYTTDKIRFASTFMNTSGNTHTLGWNGTTGELSYISSSRLVKSNIEPIPYGLIDVLKLEPRKYIDQQGEGKLGFIADEVQSIIPEYVSVGKKSMLTGNEEDVEEIPLSVHYAEITAVLTKAIQEQQAIIESLKSRLEALEAKQ